MTTADCARKSTDKPPGKETLGHIHGYCPSLKLIRIAVHHGIWRQISTSIQTHSTETYEDSEVKKWHFPSAVSEVSHIEWELKEMLIHMKVMPNDREGRIRLKIDILQFHESELHEDFFTDEEGEVNINHEKALRAFEQSRPDRVAFDYQGRVCALLEFTRPMDASSESPPRWAERKDTLKSDKYERLRNFIEYKSRN